MDKISQFTPAMFPQWVQANGPNMVAFMEAYMEWMESVGNVEYVASNILNIRNIDNTFDQFIINFQYEFMNSLPANIAANKRLLLKHIVNLYQSKGSKRGFALLFRILFDTDITMYLPGTDMMKLSDNQWIQPAYIEVTDSPYLPQLVGQSIYALNSRATALIESYDVISQNDKVINILSLSEINGNFLYGDSIYSPEVSYSSNNAPLITGSLSASSIINGGINWNIGDLVNINGSGLSKASGALGRVSTVMSENGKVVFDLQYGGFGYTMNAVISVLGGGGSGATFKVGSLINQKTYQVNIDTISSYYNTVLDIPTSGFTLNYGVGGNTGVFDINELIVATSANSVQLDFSYLTSNGLANFESLSNSSLSIAGLDVVNLQPNFLTVLGTQASLSNLRGGAILVSNTSHSVIQINSLITGIQTNSSNGQIIASNSSSITIENCNNYILPYANVVGQTSGAYANVLSVVRDTNWDFPIGGTTNMDTALDDLLTYETLIIGTIASLADQNPGGEYGSNPTITVEEPLIAGLSIPDGLGGVWGLDANVVGNAIYANGVATSVQIISAGFGFEPGDQLEMTNANNTSSILGTAIVDSYGVGVGYWTSNNSFVSGTQHLTDSYYYQNFSYEIQTQVSTSQFANAVVQLMHPVGYQLFGRFAVHDIQSITPSLIYEQVQLGNSYANGSFEEISTEQ